MGKSGVGSGRVCHSVMLTSSMPRGMKSVFVRRSYTGDTDIAPRLYFSQSPRATLPTVDQRRIQKQCSAPNPNRKP